MINVIIVDDQAMVREGIATLLTLTGEFHVVASAENGEQALEQIHRNPDADIVLMDIRMPVMTGIEAVRQLRVTNNDIPVLLLTTFDEADSQASGRNAGANGYLLKDAKIEELVAIIHQVLGGERPFPLKSDANPVEVLTQKEFEVLKAIVSGKSNKEIASTMHLSLGTIKNYNSSIFNKLSVKSRTQAIAAAKQQGLV